MKYSNIIIVIMSLCLSNLVAQEIDINSDSILYVTSVDEAFMIDKESKSLLKIRARSNSIVDAIESWGFVFEFEKKITPSLSITPSLEISRSSIFIRYGAQLRYYYRMKDLMESGKQANNLSSSYFAFSFSDDLRSFFTKRKLYTLSYGVQKRFLNYGFIDYSINLSMAPLTGTSSREYGLNTRMNVGLGIGKNYKIKEEAKCPIFKCYTNRRSAFKINLNNITGVQFYDLSGANNLWFTFINPNIIYEQKISNSPLSIQNDLGLSMFLGNYGVDNSINFRYNISNRIGFKYYVTQRKNIRNGKSGNNLSGPYAFARLATVHGKSVINVNIGVPSTLTEEFSEYNIDIGYGLQKEVLKNLFFDIDIGLRKNIKSSFPGSDKSIQIISDIKAGFMF